MKCKYCGSENTELIRVSKGQRSSLWVYDCNSCSSVSTYEGYTDKQLERLKANGLPVDNVSPAARDLIRNHRYEDSE